MSKIEWTGETWNVIVGCSVVSPGCTNCYAMKEAWRFGHNPKLPQYRGLTEMTKGGSVWNGKLNFVESALLKPLKRKKPTTYFVNSMGDLFHEGVPDEWIDRVFAVMALCPQHTFQVLTKRAERMLGYLSNKNRHQIIAFDSVINVMNSFARGWNSEGIFGKNRSRAIGAANVWPLPNVWLGVSAEDQTRANERIPHLLETPAAIRFVSAEPLLGAIDLTKLCDGGGRIDCLQGYQASPTGAPGYYLNSPTGKKIHWIICGGESGRNARPMHPDWARSIRDQCCDAEVSFFFKQWGMWLPSDQACTVSYAGKPMDVDAIDEFDWGDADERGALHYWDNGETDLTSIHLKKKQSGRLLDGREWNGVPR